MADDELEDALAQQRLSTSWRLGEILVDRVRAEITRGKVMTDDWLDVHRVWHNLGGRSTATMMFGGIETQAERIEHLHQIRNLQDRTGGFRAFIPWTFLPANTLGTTRSPSAAPITCGP